MNRPCLKCGRPIPKGSRCGGCSLRSTNTRRWAQLAKHVIRRDGRCANCGSTENLRADHITPLAEGGKEFDPANVRCLCQPCNRKRQNEDVTTTLKTKPSGAVEGTLSVG